MTLLYWQTYLAGLLSGWLSGAVGLLAPRIAAWAWSRIKAVGVGVYLVVRGKK